MHIITDIITMMSGERVKVKTKSYQNDMVTFKNKDDVLTALIHLGYLAYDRREQMAYIPNEELTAATRRNPKNISVSLRSMKNKKEYEKMYYVPDGTKTCGYYECKKCGNRFLSLQTMEKIPCPDCEAEVDYEIGPGESLEDVLDTAVLLQKIEGEEEVEKMDALLSLAITGGDFDWI